MPVDLDYRRRCAFGSLLLLLLSVLVSCDKPTSTPIRPEAGSMPTHSVCELMNDLGAFAGKRVKVRGIYYYGLRDTACSGEIVAGGRSWPKVLGLVETESPPDAGSPEGSNGGDRGLEKLHAEHHRLGQSRMRAEIWVTVVGRLRGPTDHWVPNSGVVGGFGHLGSLPAELLIERVLDVAVVSTPTFDYAFREKPDA